MNKSKLLKVSALAFVLSLSAGLCSAFTETKVSANTPAPTSEIIGKNLSLDDNIYVLYAVDFQNTLETDETGVLVWTAPQETYDYQTANAVLYSTGTMTNNSVTYPTFSYNKLSAKQMTEVIFASSYVERDGVYYYGEVEKYSILEYAYNKLGKTEKTETDDEDLKTLLTAMLNYGAAAQIYKDYNLDKLATDNYVHVRIENATFEDGFNYGLFEAGDEVKFTIPEGYELSENAPEYIREENGEYILTVPTEKLILTDLVVEAKKYSQGLKYTYLESTDSYEVSGIGECKDTDLIIPNTYAGKAVTSIGKKAFYDCSCLTSVTIPNSVTSIGYEAFSYCSSLTSIDIPNSVTTIDYYAFSYCSSLTSVTIPNSVTTIKEKAFVYCIGLTRVDIPNSVLSINSGLFMCCHSLKSVTIGNSVTTIWDSAFYDCDSLTSFTIPDSVTFIGPEAFLSCDGLTTVTISGFVKSIGNKAFYNCASLTSIIIGDSVKTIGREAFSYCKSLTSVTIGNSVTSISWSAFSNCKSLTNITIPESVTSIGDYAFHNCNNLTSVTFENPNGWWYASSSSATSGTEISATDLANTETAATYLKSTYYNYYWKRTVTE